MSAELERRIARLEAMLTPPEPMLPPLVITRLRDDPDAALERYRAEHSGREPPLVICVGYVSADHNADGTCALPTFSTAKGPMVVLPDNGRD